jgi:hypothetical protein
VPQIQWAPAWVTWREGNGYVGWAPLPPSARVSSGGYVEVHETVVAPRFVFVQESHMLEPVHPKTVIVNNQTVVNKTVNITRIQVVNNNTVINQGPRTEIIEHASGKTVTPTPIQDLRHQEEAPVAKRQHDPPGQAKKGRSDSPGHDKTDSVLPPGHEPKVAPTETANTTTTPPAKAPEQPVIRPAQPAIKPAQPVIQNEVANVPVQPEVKKENAKTSEHAKPEPEKAQHNNRKSDAIPVNARTLPNPQPNPVAAPHQPENNVSSVNANSGTHGNAAPQPQLSSPKAAHESHPGNSQKEQKNKKGEDTTSAQQ